MSKYHFVENLMSLLIYAHAIRFPGSKVVRSIALQVDTVRVFYCWSLFISEYCQDEL